MSTRYFTWLVLLLSLPARAVFCDADPRASAGARAKASPEIRAIWVTRWDFQSARDVRAMVSNCESLGLNRIYFQVRGQADAFYPSSLEPWGEELGGDPGYDPLALAISECKKRKIEIHAWVNVLPGWKGASAPRSKRHVFHRHPDWFLKDRNGRRRLLSSERYTLLNPCLPEVRSHLVNVIGEIARYDVDGIQFDYIRFLSRNVKNGEDVPYDSPTLAMFRRQSGVYPSRRPDAWNRFRRDAMSTLVRDLCSEIRRARPRAVISVAAVKDLEHARDHLFQDVPAWWRKGWIDEVTPMIYTSSRGDFRRFVRDFVDEIPASRVIPGLGIYRIPANEGGTQISIARENSAGGFALFAYTSLFLSRSPDSSRAARSAELRARMRKMVAAASREDLASTR